MKRELTLTVKYEDKWNDEVYRHWEMTVTGERAEMLAEALQAILIVAGSKR